jgi:predicted DCC family thiol-disulfide oxidoreductase YuxK
MAPQTRKDHRSCSFAGRTCPASVPGYADSVKSHPTHGRAVLLYDEDCGFCRWSVSKLLAWDRRRNLLRPVALQDAEADALLGKIGDGRKMASWHLVTPDGRVRSGSDAVADLAGLLPGGMPIALLARAFPSLTDAAYRLVARHRARLAAAVGEKACAVDPKREQVDRRRPPREGTSTG